MELVNDFTVEVPIDEAWKILTDVERIAPCLPGAQLQEVNGDTYSGVVKVKVGDDNMISAAEGNGPVNALDLALRKDLGKYQKYIAGLNLTDYRVRILNGGTGAVTRVLIESEDEAGERWTTVGVSPNIIDASFQALMDSIIFKLVKSGAPA